MDVANCINITGLYINGEYMNNTIQYARYPR